MSRASRYLRWLAVLLAAAGCWHAASVAFGQSGREVPISIIVVSSEAEANQVAAQLKAGADFGALAKRQSTDPTANDSGYMGVLDPAKLRAELREALKGVAPGQISGITQIPSGYVILKVLNAPPAGNTPEPARALDLAGQSAIQPTPDFAGYAEANLAFSKYPKPAGWEDDIAAGCSARVNSVKEFSAQLDAYLKAPGSDASTFGDVNSILSNLYSFRGEMDQSITYREKAYQLAQKQAPAKALLLEEGLGVAYLHQAGMTLYDKFVFPTPLNPAQLTAAEKAELAKATEYFLAILRRSPDDLDARWLLNVTAMLAGGYPGSVPAQYRIDPSLLASKENVVHLTDVASAAGLVRRGMSGGLIIDDFDSDGLFDVMISSQNDCVPLQFFHNNGDGTFTDRAAQAGLSNQAGGLSMIQTDYNNDGCTDIFLLRGGWEWARRKSLLRNNCDGTFTDVTRKAGLMDPPRATQTAVWTDIDRDGKLDVLIGNENAPMQLFLNQGDGKFVDIAESAGVNKTGFVKAVVAGDYDNDGYPDLYVSNFRGQHFLFHNNHDKTFTDVTQEAGIGQQGPTFPAWFFDYDNDGLLDLFVGGYYSSLSDVASGYLGKPQKGEPLRLFHNLGNGKFRDVAPEVGLNKVFLPMGHNFGDIDNDGYLDFYLGEGNPSFAHIYPNVFFHNDGGKHFTDITASSGMGILPKGHGIAFADLDNDGDEDVVAVMGGPDPGDEHNTRLFENPGVGNDWLSVHLVGVKSNRAAIGARIKVTARDGGEKPREIYRTVGSGGSFGANPFEQHIGLGKDATVQSVEIRWPSSDTPQIVTNTGKNRVIEIREGAKTFTVLQRHAFRLGK
ncbi:MAG TPA: FG-GAP-like repeat-containing protein [Bryobacteraceae bacterium]